MNIKEFVLFKKRELLQFCIYRLIFGISYSFMIPAIPLFFNSIGIATTMIGVVMSLYGVSKALAQIPFGFVSDKIGDKLLLIIAVGLMAFIPMGYVFFNTQLLVSGVYVLQGAILGMAAPATVSILARSLDESKRGECTGFASAVFTLGGGIGAAIAGFIISKFGNYNTVFYITSIGILLTFLFIIFRIKKSNISGSNKKSNKKEIKLIINDIKKYKLGYKIVLLSFIAMLGDFIYGCVVSIFPFYGKEVLGASVGYISIIISLYLFIFGFGAPLAGWVSDKIGNKKQLYLSFIVMNLTLFTLYLIRTKILFAAIIIVYFLGATFLNASLQSLLSEFGENENIKGIVFGVVGASESIGYAIGPIASAYIYELNKNWLFLGLLIVSILVLGIYHFLHKKAQIN